MKRIYSSIFLLAMLLTVTALLMPVRVLAKDSVTAGKKTTYHTDKVDFDINGCDLVKGPDGSYGSYTIEDGCIAPGQDSEGRLKPGAVLPVSKNGGIEISCGHKKSRDAAAWWKSQLDVRQTPNNWFPDMLHYALRGRLTLWVRSYRFGTMQPVRLDINDFCVCHGKETKSFTQIASRNFRSHSSYSIVGNVGINGHKMRVYIESKHNGRKNGIYIWKMKASYLDWMARVPDDRPISQLSILGAHNAGSASLPEGFLTSTVHAQNLGLNEQMEDGIRAFDIRLKKNMKFGRLLECRDGMPEALDSMRSFLRKHPSEVLIALIGSDETGTKWPEEMQQNYREMMGKYSDILTDDFSPSTRLGDVRGKILVLRRQTDCPYGKLVTFEDNCTFEDNREFNIEDTYREHKTYKKIRLVEKHIREAHENHDPGKWYWTFTNIKWHWLHHRPYYSAWGGKFLRKPMNLSVRDFIEDKNYTHFGIVFADFYNDHCDYPQLTETVINSNFNTATEMDYIPAVVCAGSPANNKADGQEEFALSNWMSMLSDTAKVCKVSIPGTHDSLTGEGFTDAAYVNDYTTQVATLDEQLNGGMRYFDVRLVMRKDSARTILQVSHRTATIRLTFDDVLEKARKFLAANPTEFLIVKIQYDGDAMTDSEKAAWKSAIQKTNAEAGKSGLLAQFRPDLRVKDVRGKILLLSRTEYGEPVYGALTNWPDEGTDGYLRADSLAERTLVLAPCPEAAVVHKGGDNKLAARLYVQDFYNSIGSRMDAKLQAVKAMLRSSQSLSYADNVWILNHVSGFSTPKMNALGYAENASRTNALLLSLLTKEKPAKGIGIIAMDFACIDTLNQSIGTLDTISRAVMSRSLTRAIIDCNRK